MKKSFTKLTAMILAIVMVLGLAACGTDNKETTKTPEENKTTEASDKTDGETSDAQQTTEEPQVGITYPYETKDTLTYWVGNQMTISSAYSTWKESPFHTGMATKTGIEVDWIYPVEGAEVKQAYNLMWNDEVLPDMVHYSVTATEGKELLDEDMIWDLTDYLPEYAPDYWAYINAPENAAELASVTTEDGKHFMFPAMGESWYNVTYMGPAIRQDWLDECNLEMPVTIEDWEKVLVTFKERYGAKMGFVKTYFNQTRGIASGFGAFAALNTQWYLEDGKIKLAQLQPEYKEMLETLAKWYEMDLIDKDVLTLDNKGLRTKALNNEIGIVFVPMSQLTNLIKDAEKENSGADWVGMEYARVEKGAPTTSIQINAARTTGQGTFITKGCSEEKLKTALVWLNYGWTEAGNMYWNFGEENISYTVDAEGKVAWTELVLNDELGFSQAVKKYGGTSGSSPVIQKEAFVQLKNNETSAAAVYKWIENTTASEYKVPGITLTEAESDISTTKMTPISTLINEEVVKFFMGTRDFSEFDDFIKQIYDMGIEEVIAVRQAAYDRFVAREKK